MFKFALNAANCCQNEGQNRQLIINEYNFNKRICDRIERLLMCYDGIKILRVDNGRVITESKIIRKVNTYKVDFYLSVHYKKSEKCGFSTYRSPLANNRAIVLQSAIYNSVVKFTGYKSNGDSYFNTSDTIELKKAQMPAVILEVSYTDEAISKQFVLSEKFAVDVARACAAVITNLSRSTIKRELAGRYYYVKPMWDGKTAFKDRYYVYEMAELSAIELDLNVYNFLGKCVLSNNIKPFEEKKKTEKVTNIFKTANNPDTVKNEHETAEKLPLFTEKQVAKISEDNNITYEESTEKDSVKKSSRKAIIKKAAEKIKNRFRKKF